MPIFPDPGINPFDWIEVILYVDTSGPLISFPKIKPTAPFPTTVRV